MNGAARTPDDVISLPDGGGAIRGLGETFSPDLHTGTGNFTVPIALPRGRNGFQPELSLAYSSGSPNSAFGLGWTLSVPGVSRKTSKGVPVYVDVEDVFVLSGAEDLVPVPGGPAGQTRYRPRTEGLFARISRVLGADDDYWEVRTPDGLVNVYGTPGMRGNDPAAITRPGDGEPVFHWRLTRTADPFGNRIEYAYRLRQTTSDQLYLERVRYVDYTDEDGETAFLVSVDLEYEERADPFWDRRPGFELRTALRCTKLAISTHAGETRLVRTYELTYADELDGAPPPNGVSLLARIVATGHDGTETEQLPPLELGYTAFEPERRAFFPLRGMDLPATSLTRADLELVDLFGDGLPDLLEMNGTVRYWRNRGGGRFDPPRPMRRAPPDVALAQEGVQLVDADGDGRTDLLVTRAGLSGYFPLQPDGGWDRLTFRPYRRAPSFSLADSEVRLVDVDGDGVTDALRTGTRLEVYSNDPVDGWNGARRLPRRRFDVFPNVSFSDQRVRLADMTGDGLQDIVLVHDGNAEYWPSLGRGDFGPRVEMRASPTFPYGYDPRRILVGDVDGDGCADLLYVDDHAVTLWINQSGNGWSDPIEIEGTPSVTDADDVRIADVLGSGVAGVLWSSDRRLPGADTMFFLDFTGDRKPYLLNELDNNLGAHSRIEYSPSTRFLLADAKQRSTRWKETLPLPIQTVSKIVVDDVFSRTRLASQYSYHHGLWDGGEREFRGFGRVEQLDTLNAAEFSASADRGSDAFEAVPEELFSPPTLTKTWFHQGLLAEGSADPTDGGFSSEYWPGDPRRELDAQRPPPSATARRAAARSLRGRVLRSEVYCLDNTPRERAPLRITENSYAVSHLPVGSPWPEAPERWQELVSFPHILVERSDQWERGDDPLIQFTFTDDYDEFGQPREETRICLPRRRARRQPLRAAVLGSVAPDEERILATHVRTVYAVPQPGSEIRDRPAHVRTFELAEPDSVDEASPDDLGRVLEDHATAAGNVRSRFGQAMESWNPGDPLPSAVRLIGHTVHHYDGRAYVGLEAGSMGPYGALTRTEVLAFTDREVDAAYGSDRPSYLGGGTALPAGAPTGFANDLGYQRSSDSPLGYHDGYYVDVLSRKFDFQDEPAISSAGVVLGFRDARRNESSVRFDDFVLLAKEMTNAAGLRTIAELDYRTFHPSSVTDWNGNTVSFEFSPLGFLRREFLTGRNGEGGSSTKPELEYIHDLTAVMRTRGETSPQPASVHVTRRVRHASEGASDETVETRDYSDGFGRLVQRRTRAEEWVLGQRGDDAGLPATAGVEPASAAAVRVTDRVAVSGWRVYDNKGQIIQEYEAFFSAGWQFEGGPRARAGIHTTLRYDALGRRMQTARPDGSQEWILAGRPRALDAPRELVPTPWESSIYDPNDLAPLSASRTGASLGARVPSGHHFTPSTSVVDGLGRVVCRVLRNGREDDDRFVLRSEYDLRGNLLAVTDPLGRTAVRYAHDLLGRVLRVESIDAGVRTSVYDAAGNLVEQRDGKGNVSLRQYDSLNRLTQVWAREESAQPLTLRERLVYGDEGARAAARENNLLGRLRGHYDEAGLTTFDDYDLKGNLVATTRRVVSDTAVAAEWVANWDGPDSEADLEPLGYTSSFEFDALNRVVKATFPQDASGARGTVSVHYNGAGALERIELDGTPYVTTSLYNARGQRVLLAFGNGVMMRFLYDAETFQVIRVRSERYVATESATERSWSGTGAPLQDSTYAYDLIGNVLRIEERSPASGVAGSRAGRDALIREFAYDPLYRLVAAGGRACTSIPIPRPIGDLARCGSFAGPFAPGAPVPNQRNAPDLTEAYTETYDYDPAGNLIRLDYAADNRRWVREFGHADQPPNEWANAASNRTTSLVQGSTTDTYTYDANGNLETQNTDRRLRSDHRDRLVAFEIRPSGAAAPSFEARYLYGADGRRVKKWTRTNGVGAGTSTVYIGDSFEHFPGNPTGPNNYLHITDGTERLALVRRGPPHPADTGPPIQYQLNDHTGSRGITVGDDGTWVNREEFFPYGGTSFGGFSRKRYRFANKERDENTGLYYYGARYYAPWLGRWTSPDPAGPIDGVNLYVYALNNPLRFSDPLGAQVKDDVSPVTKIQLSGRAPGINPLEFEGSAQILQANLNATARASPPPPPRGPDALMLGFALRIADDAEALASLPLGIDPSTGQFSTAVLIQFHKHQLSRRFVPVLAIADMFEQTGQDLGVGAAALIQSDDITAGYHLMPGIISAGSMIQGGLSGLQQWSRARPFQTNRGPFNTDVGPSYSVNTPPRKGAHNLVIEVNQPGRADPIARWREVSGEMTPAQKAMQFPDGMNSSHTEAKGLTRFVPEKGDEVVMRGQLEPCRSSCAPILREKARQTGSTFRYEWEEGGTQYTRWYIGRD